MPIKLPPNFDYRRIKLDAAEKHIRDILKVNVENWVKFRHAIHVGNNASNLSARHPIPEEVKASYRELAKSHYEVVTSIGAAAAVLQRTQQTMHSVEYLAHIKGIYFHFGCVLDNLARLIFIINDSDAPKKKRGTHLLRHWIDWGSCGNYAGYARLRKSVQLRGIINIRNNLTHSWKIPMAHHPNGTLFWPKAARTKRDHPWPYDEMNIIRKRYRKWIPLRDMVRDDYKYMVSLQNRVFGRLTTDVGKFEKNHKLKIV